MHVIMGLFEVHETSGKIWLFNLNNYFQNFNQCIMWLHLSKMKVVICQKKNLHCVPSFEPLTFITVYEGRCFGHVMFKVCQDATNDDKVCKGLMQVSVKMHNLLHRRQLHGQRNLGTCKNGRRLALNMGCHLENVRPLSKLDLHPKSPCLKRPWN